MRTSIASVIGVGVLFLALGVLDVYRGVAPLFASASPSHLAGDDVQVLAIGIAALIGGIFVLRGRNWARWLLAGWMVLHVAISIGQPTALVAHLVIFGFVTFLLFRSSASAHFNLTPSIGDRSRDRPT
ncbi:MAG: hypothetical protein ABI601_02910 [bacterium]